MERGKGESRENAEEAGVHSAGCALWTASLQSIYKQKLHTAHSCLRTACDAVRDGLPAMADEAWNGAGWTMWETGCTRGGRVERAPPELQVASWWGAEVLGDTRDGKDKLVCSPVIQRRQDCMSEAVGKKWEPDCLGHTQPCTEEKASLPWMPEKKDRRRRKEPYNSKIHL